MTLGTILGVVGCVLPFVATLPNRADRRMKWDIFTGIYWTALIVWLVMR